jgi:hypothetical protein
MQASILVGSVAIPVASNGGFVRYLLMRMLIPPMAFAQRLGYRIYNRLTAAALRRQL